MAYLLLLALLVLPVAAYRARPERALGVVLVTLVLVPGTLPYLHLPGALTVHRVVAGTALLGLLQRVRRGQVPRDVLRVPAVARRFALLLGVAGVLGVGFLLAPSDPGSAARAWEALAAQGFVLMVVVALLRCCPSVERALLPLVLAVVASAAVALVERATGASFARAWFRLAPELLGTGPAQVLAERGGHVRVRAAADFTLAFAWGTTAVVPLLLVLASRGRRWLRGALLASSVVVLLALTWTYTRSIVLPAAVAVAVMAGVLRDRLLRYVVAAGAGVVGLVVLASPQLQQDFSVAIDTGSIDVRFARLPVVMSLASAHPYKGIGLAGLSERGIPTTDSSFELLYAETGAIGVAVLAAVLLCGVAAAARPLLSRDHDDRVLGAGLGLGAALLVGSAFVYDTFTTPSSAELFWVLVGGGVVAAERSRALVPVPALGRYGTGLALAGLVLVGLVLRSTGSTSVGRTWQLETLSPAVNTAAAPSYAGLQLQTTLCQVVEQQVRGDVDCRGSEPAPDGSNGRAPGQTLLELRAASSFGLRTLAQQAVVAIRSVPTLEHVELVPRTPERSGIPSGLRTAPAALLALGLALLLPVGGTRPRG